MGLLLQVLGLLFWSSVFFISLVLGKTHHRSFHVMSTPYTRLCKTKNILTVNGQFPGPTLHVSKGDKVIIKVTNQAEENVTLHWHGLKQPRDPWHDGPEFVTQCPIQPKTKFIYKLNFTTEEGTIWWHAHSDWTRATIHGAIIIHPKNGNSYPFPEPHAEVLIILGEWWNNDVMEVLKNTIQSGGEPEISDAFTINGQPGYLYPCSEKETFRMHVRHGKTYLLRIINGAMISEHFFSIAQHSLTVVGTDGSYTKPFRTDILLITPGQTMDILLTANQPPNLYSMAARSYSGAPVGYDKTTTTAILEYTGFYPHTSIPFLPYLPNYNDTKAATNFTRSLKSLVDRDHPIQVPLTIDTHLFFTVSVNLIPCPSGSCQGPFGLKGAASFNNITFVNPSIDILQAYYAKTGGVFYENFPSIPSLAFNFTGDNLPQNLWASELGTQVKILEYNSSVEIILQGTNVVVADNHPVHLHGHNFYVVGFGYGNFDPKQDPFGFNLVDPPEQNTVAVPKSGWVAVRFIANNPGVWFMHCHLEHHSTWGMNMVFIVKSGETQDASMLPPPHDLPRC